MPLLQTKLDFDLKSGFSSICFVDVSSTLSKPAVCSLHFGDALRARFQELYKKLFRPCTSSVNEAQQGQIIPEMIALDCINIAPATIAGYLLEYPVIYCWEMPIESTGVPTTGHFQQDHLSNCLGTVPLTVCSIRAHHIVR